MKDGWFYDPLTPPCCYYRYDGPYLTRKPPPCNQPPVVAAVGAAVAGGITVSAAGVIGFSLTNALIAGVSSLVLSGLSMLLAPDPPSTDLGSFASFRNQGISRQIRQPITERRLVYGEARTSGPIAFISSTSSNKYLHMVIMLASHEVEEIGEIFINDISITDDMLTSDVVNTGRYNNLIRIKKYLGLDSQTADPDLVSEVTEWTTNHRLRGIAYIYVRVQWDRNAFPGGIPNFSAWVKGKNVLDTRDSTTRWSPNVALMARDYLVDANYGLATDSTDIDTTELDAAANTCEEYVDTTSLDDTIESADTSSEIITLTGKNDRLCFNTADRVRLVGASLPGGLAVDTDYYVIVYQRKDTARIKLATSYANCIAGTAINITSDGTGTISKLAEPRYLGGGVLKTSSERGKNLQEILSGMAGQAVNAGGVWRILAGEYVTPTIDFTVNDIVGPIKVQTKVSRRDRFNLVQGVYSAQINDGNPSDYPVVENSTYQTNDGETLRRNLDLPFTQRPHTAMRIAKIDLERSRQEIVFSADFKLTAFKVQVGDNFQFTESRYGWSSKVFEVIDWTLNVNEGRPVINITSRENASSVYDWNNGEETSVDPALNTDLPDPFTVSIVTGFSLDSVLVLTEGQDKTYKVIASWDDHPDEFVLNGGFYELEWKRATETVYKSNAQIDATVTSAQVPQLEPDVLYDLRIFAYNNLGVKSAETLIEDFLVGTTVTTDTEDWENSTESRDPDDWETDSGIASEDWES